VRLTDDGAFAPIQRSMLRLRPADCNAEQVMMARRLHVDAIIDARAKQGLKR
jgi:hypothetical protein